MQKFKKLLLATVLLMTVFLVGGVKSAGTISGNDTWSRNTQGDYMKNSGYQAYPITSFLRGGQYRPFQPERVRTKETIINAGDTGITISRKGTDRPAYVNGFLSVEGFKKGTTNLNNTKIRIPDLYKIAGQNLDAEVEIIKLVTNYEYAHARVYINKHTESDWFLGWGCYGGKNEVTEYVDIDFGLINGEKAATCQVTVKISLFYGNNGTEEDGQPYTNEKLIAYSNDIDGPSVNSSNVSIGGYEVLRYPNVAKQNIYLPIEANKHVLKVNNTTGFISGTIDSSVDELWDNEDKRKVSVLVKDDANLKNGSITITHGWQIYLQDLARYSNLDENHFIKNGNGYIQGPTSYGQTDIQYFLPVLKVNHKSDAGGTINGVYDADGNVLTYANDGEPVTTEPDEYKAYGDTSNGSKETIKDGYCSTLGWKAYKYNTDTSITLKNSRNATINPNAQGYYTLAQIKSAKITEDTTFKVFHKQCPPPEKRIKAETTPVANQPVKVGDVLTYEISYTNYKSTSQTVKIEDTLSTGLEFAGKVSGSATTTSQIGAKGKITFTDTVAAHETKTIVYKAKVNSEAEERVENDAKVIVGNDPAVELNPIKNPIPSKTYGGTESTNPGWNHKEVKVGQKILYKVKIPNTTTSATTVVLTDVLSKGLTYNKDIKVTDGTITASTTPSVNSDTKETTLVWTITIPANKTAVVEYSATVNKDAINMVNNNAQAKYPNNQTIQLAELHNPVPRKQYDENTANGANGMIVQKEDIITYNIGFANPKTTAQKIELRDTLSKGLAYKEGTAKICNVEKTQCQKITEVMTEDVRKNQDGTTTILWTINSMAGLGIKTIVYDIEVTGETVKVDNDFDIKYPGGNWTDINELKNPVSVKEYSKDTKAGYDQSAVAVRDRITYQIRYVNVAEEKVTATIKDKLSKGIEYVKGTAKINGEKIEDPEISKDNRVLVWTRELEPEQEETLTYEVIVTGEMTEVNNEASMIYSNNPEIERKIGELHNPVPQKTYANTSKIKVFGEEVKKDDVITYSIAYSNVKDKKASIIITDQLSKGLEYRKSTARINGKKTDPDNVVKTANGTMLIWVTELEANKAAELTYEARVTGETAFVENNADIQYDSDPAIHLDELRNPLPGTPGVPVPNTASTVSKLAISIGALLMCVGGLVILKRRQV